MIRVLIFFAVLFAFTPFQAQAGAFRFGKQQSVKTIEDVSVKGPEGEALYLGHLVETQFLLLGVYVKDAGYVLGIKGNYGTFIPLDQAKISEMQAAGQLSNPLPGYNLSLFDYVIGYSLWLTLLGFGAWAAFKKMKARRVAI